MLPYRLDEESMTEREMLVAAFNELLAAERAGAQVAAASLKEVTDEAQRRMLHQIHRGEADSCRRLRECILKLGELPTRERGAFYEKCMAISDMTERLALVDRGQKWVIRKLEALLPELTDPWLLEQMEAVLATHRDNSHDYALHTGL